MIIRRGLRITSLYFGIILIFGCSTDKSINQKSTSLFEELSGETTQIDFGNHLTDELGRNIVDYLYYYNGSGIGVADFDGDGLEDVFIGTNMLGDRLYKNLGNLQFEDISSRSPSLSNEWWTTGINVGDVNNDGHLDIYVSKVMPMSKDSNAHNLLLINDGTGAFVDKSKDYGVDFAGYSTQSVFFDYDKDGDLDLYLLNHTVHSVRSYGDIKKRLEKDSLSGDRLYENRLDSEGSFVDVTDRCGIYSSPLGYGLAVMATDLNNDGWPDIYVGNDFHENDYLYINQKDGTFKESVAEYFANTTQFSMGVDVADVDGDGLLDVFTTDMMPDEANVLMVSGGEDTDQVKRIKNELGFELQNARNHLQYQSKTGQFKDVSFMTNTYASDWSWSPLIADFNHDLRQDIFVSNGIVKRPNDLDYINYVNASAQQNTTTDVADLISKMPEQPLQNILFLQANEPLLPFQKTKIGSPGFSTGAAYADFDQDGDLDIILNNINDNVTILKNQFVQEPNYLSIQLVDTTHHSTLGTRVTLHTSLGDMVKEKSIVKGFASSSTHTVHFALNENTKVDSVSIEWPDFTKQVVVQIETNKSVVISKTGTATYTPAEFNKNYVVSPFSFKHYENNYIDNNNEKLIPELLSREGPASIAEDLNGDGLIDLYLGGGRDQAPVILFANKGGSFEQVSIKELAGESRYEDVDAATIDFDGDGDKDIYVVSGGNDLPELHELLEDRLYLNNGNGSFRRVPLQLPRTNGSCVSVADFDKDGHEDVFVGGRSIPGSYGLSPISFVLRNTGGKGIEIFAKERWGMVTDAQWADIDNDGSVDLITCGDWSNIRVFLNQNGELKEATEQMGLANNEGFWNCIKVTDANGDGRLDIIGGNSGKNQKWQASPNNPIELFVGDYDGNQYSDPVIFFDYQGQRMPFGSLDRLASNTPILKKKFTSYASFKGVSKLSDLYEKENEIAEYKKVVNTVSAIFLNLEKGFQKTELPLDCQLTDLQDVFLDENQLWVAGNNNNYVAELGANFSNPLSIVDINNKDGRLIFGNARDINLPPRTVCKAIHKISDDEYLIITNSSNAYKVKSK